MPGALPEGLVTTTDSVGEEIGSIDRVDLEDVARLWRDYSTSRALLQHGVGERLANFFWRIWSNPNINRSITGETVARIFLAISGGEDRIRTTPIPSPRSTSPLSHGQITPTQSSPQSDIQLPGSTTNYEASAGPSIKPARTPSAAVSPPPPILKKPRSGSEVPPSTVQFSMTDQVESVSSREQPTSPASETSSPLSPPVMERTSSNGGRKKTSYVTAGGARARTRPSLPRRKSSQGTQSASADAKKSPRLPSIKSPPRSPGLRENPPKAGNLAATRHPPPGLPALPATSTSFALPSTSSWQDVSSPVSSHRDPSTAATSQQPSSWLVDMNFRDKFVENQKKTASQMNLSSLGRSKSTVRFWDELPERTEPKAEPASTVQHAAVIQNKIPLGRTASFSTGEEAISNEEDDNGGDHHDTSSLPRTKSQLTMMITNERRKSGSYELGDGPMLQGQQPPEHAEKSAKDDVDNNEEDGEDELVMMGRRDGVTKAGGLSSTAKGKRRMSPKEGEEFRYHSPPTPPLY